MQKKGRTCCLWQHQESPLKSASLTDPQVDGEKLKAELETTRYAISELEEAMKDKGEKTKALGDNSSQETKQLKEKIISLTSTIELKEFQISQQESQMAVIRSHQGNCHCLLQ